MHTRWIIEQETWQPENEQKLITAITEQGMSYSFFEYRPFDDEGNTKRILKLFSADDIPVFYCSLNMCKFIKKELPWITGIYCDLPNYECTKYYPILGEYLLNRDYYMLPFGEVLRLKNRVFDQYYEVFIRPSSGFKTFSGQLIDIDDLEKQLEAMKLYGITDDEIVIISGIKTIRCEWRFVVVNKEVVSGCLYRDSGFLKEEERKKLTERADEYARGIALIYQPDKCFTIDLACLLSGPPMLLEINAFSSSVLYECDIPTVVREVSKMAAKEFDSMYQY
jgi:hypothetical protein